MHGTSALRDRPDLRLPGGRSSPPSGRTWTVDESSAPRWVLPAEDGLILAIGRAVYGFAQFERSVERAREALDGLLGGRSDGHEAGEAPLLALEGMANARSPDGETFAQLLRIDRLHRALKSRRDGLLRIHRPDPDSDAQRAGLVGGAACAWCVEDILRLARDIEAAAVETNRLLRKGLLSSRPPGVRGDPA